MADFSSEEQAAKDIVESGPKDAAIIAVYELAVAFARAKDFDKAEYWRQQLFAVDSMALTEIVNLSEIIDEEKSGAIAQSHLDLWPELFKALTSEETNALYFALKEKDLRADEVVFDQGSRNANLYFVVSGQLKVIHGKGDREYLLKNLAPGDLAGDDTFFSISLCTTTLVTITRAKLKYLQREKLDSWQQQFPGLERKLHDYILSAPKISDLLKKKGMDRRIQNRYPVAGIVMVELLNASGKSLGKAFKGKFMDISVGGASFFIKVSKRETVRLLLGRRINFSLVSEVPALKDKLSCLGRVTGVANHLFNDYSVHVRFDEPLGEDVVTLLASNLKPAQ